jgi:uncharacterized protein HemX
MGAWSYVAAIVLALGFVGGVYQTGYNAASREAQVDVIKSERDAARADAATQKAAAENANSLAGDLATASAADQSQLQRLRHELSRAGNECRLGPVAGRMRLVR